MELTPEERHRIYVEEQVRMEARRDIESKRMTAGKVVGGLALAVIGLLGFIWVVGVIKSLNETPLARARRAADECVQAVQLRLAADGYTHAEGRLGAAMKCAAEIEQVDREVQAWKVKEAADLSAREAAGRK